MPRTVCSCARRPNELGAMRMLRRVHVTSRCVPQPPFVCHPVGSSVLNHRPSQIDAQGRVGGERCGDDTTVTAASGVLHSGLVAWPSSGCREASQAESASSLSAAALLMCRLFRPSASLAPHRPPRRSSAAPFRLALTDGSGGASWVTRVDHEVAAVDRATELSMCVATPSRLDSWDEKRREDSGRVTAQRSGGGASGGRERAMQPQPQPQLHRQRNPHMQPQRHHPRVESCCSVWWQQW